MGNATPTRKVTGAAAGGAAGVVVVWIIGLFGVDVPGEVGAALSTVMSFAGGYIVREA